MSSLKLQSKRRCDAGFRLAVVVALSLVPFLALGKPRGSQPKADRSALVNAIKSGDVAAVKLAIKRGANLNAIGNDGFTPLTQSIEKKQLNMVKLLTMSGANVNKQDGKGECPIVAAAWTGNTEFVLQLLQGGASIDGRSRDGSSAMSRVIEHGDVAMVTFLAEKHANPNLRAPTQWSPLHWVVGSLGDSGRPLLALLLKNHANVNAIDADGTYPLHQAVNCGVPIVEMLLNAGAKVNCRTADSGRTPLHKAAIESITVTEYLLSHGANVNARSKDHQTPLDDVERQIKLEIQYHQQFYPNLKQTRALLLKHGAIR